MKNKICVVDYKAGNLKSVELALKYLGADFTVTARPEDVAQADRVIFPGVGEAYSTMSVLEATGLGAALRSFFASGKPLFGICIGCQIALAASEERDTTCLGLIPGQVKRFPPGHKEQGEQGIRLKVPHMGWNQVCHKNRHFLFKDIPDNSSFYFVHSYYPLPENPAHIIGETDYGFAFASALALDNLLAVQFHPEKSGKWGLKLLDNFLQWKART